MRISLFLSWVFLHLVFQGFKTQIGMQKGITAKIFFSEIFCFSCVLTSDFTKMTKISQPKPSPVPMRPMIPAIFYFTIMGPISFFRRFNFYEKSRNHLC